MKIAQKNFWFAVVGGMILGGAFTISAFAEPTASPASTTSYPPVNVGPETQYRTGRIGIGNGGSTLPAQALVDANTFYSSGVFSTETLSVKQNATLVGNVNVGGRSIIAGVLRVGQLVAGPANTSYLPGYSSGTNPSEKFYLPAGATTNLGRGNTCNVSIGTNCPPGTMLLKVGSSNAVCKYINPVANSGSLGNCNTSGYPTIAITLTNTSQNSNTCKATKTYTSSASGTTYWEIKGVNDTEWTSNGTGATKDVVVNMGSSSAAVYDLKAYTFNNGLPATSTVTVSAVYSSACISQGGGSGGSTGL